MMKTIKEKLKRLLIRLRAFFHLRPSRKKATKSQIDLFNKVKIGDLVFCDMPLNEINLEKIKSGHTSRPYLVVKKTDNSIYGYQCTSQKKNGLTGVTRYRIPHSRYNLYKKGDEGIVATDTILDLRRPRELSVSNLRFYMTTLQDIDLMLIERKLTALNNPRHIHFDDIEIKALVGDIYLNNNELYYVYSEFKNDLSCFCLSEVNYKNDMVITINDKDYLIDINNKTNIKLNESKLVFICDSNRIKTINNEISKEKERKSLIKREKKAKNNKKKSEIILRYEIGAIYKCAVSEKLMVYVYSIGKDDFGVDYELISGIDTFFLNKVFIDDACKTDIQISDETMDIIVEECIYRNGKLEKYFDQYYYGLQE